MATAGDVGQGSARSDVDELRSCFVGGCSSPPVEIAVGPGYSLQDGPGVALAATCAAHRGAAVASWDRREDVELLPAEDDSNWLQALLASLAAGLAVWWLHR